MSTVVPAPCHPHRRHLAGGLCRPCYHRRAKFGITPEQYDAMLKEQGGVCAICREPETGRNRAGAVSLAVDHDHETGLVRGLLCNTCNRGIGLLKDRPDILRSALQYLER